MYQSYWKKLSSVKFLGGSRHLLLTGYAVCENYLGVHNVHIMLPGV